jgi:D-tagatose-1,6-bisphosphate aldolase subunit GatZ/KbaZ
MRLKDDSRYLPLSDEKIARRAVRLIKACESVRTQDVSYVVGSEVPIPGGTTAGESELKVTLVKDIKDTISHLQSELNIYGIGHVMEDIVGIVVQPGVEFGDNEIHHYDRSKTIDLAHYISTQKRLVYEGHSTDYQLKENLRKMIEDGIRILKVGPALTFYFREAVYALENIEKEYAFEQPSKIRDIYEKEMIEHPEKWKDYYFGSEIDMVIKRHFSYCDRIRYYSNYQEVQDAMKRLLNNLSMVNIPISLISQYFPNQSCRILSGAIKATPEDLILDKIGDILDDYYYAIS